MPLDLLGDEMPAPTPEKGRRKSTKPWGYFAPPGTGPIGATCGDCAHLYRKRGASKVFPKCERSRGKWTGGRASDILIRSPACSGWESV